MKRFLILATFVFSVSLGFSATHEVNMPQDSLTVYDFPEKMPQYPGGSGAMDDFIRTNLVYPKGALDAGVSGKVYVQFIVERDGSVTSPQIRRGVNPELDREALKLVKKMPNWIPGSVKGKMVRVKYVLPITFVPA